MSLFAHLQGWRIARAIKRRNYYGPFFQASLTLLRHYNVVYVENSKVCCTKVKKQLLEIDNWPKHWDDILEKEWFIHNKEITRMIGAADLTYAALAKILRDPDYFRFGFVRNPYSRLLSAYKDKVFAPQKSSEKKNYVAVACRIKAATQGGDPRRIDLDKTPVTFPEFISYVSKQRPYDMDRHWYPQYLTMWYPFFNFDFIGRFENFSDDLRTVLIKIGAPESTIDSVDVRENVSFKTSVRYYNEHLAESVYKKFRRDFHIFRYSPRSWKEY